MIMFWNQEEVFCGFSMQKFNDVLDRLIEKGIKYKYRIVNYGSTRRSGAFGENPGQSIMYYVYVHKKDADLACEAVNRVRL